MIVVRATCSGCGEVQDLRMAGFDREYAERFAGLLDGTSPMYVHPVDERSIIGKCGRCNARFRCEVLEMPDSEVPA